MPTLHAISAAQPVNTLDTGADGRLESVIAAHLGTTFPALAITVIHGGDVVLNAGWGWVDPGGQQHAAQPDTLFDLASVSKLFTATAFLALMSRGGAALHDPLVALIPEFGVSGPRPLDGGQDPHTRAMLPAPEAIQGHVADPARVTLYHLLTHTSGLAPWRDVFNAAGPAPPPPDQVDSVPRTERWRKALHALCHYPFVGQPGDGVVRYSDLGLMLLGEAAGRLHGESGGMPAALEAAVHACVTERLGLASITYNPLSHGHIRDAIAPTENDPGWRGRRCWGEVHDENACGVGGIAGHAGLFGTARDVAALGQAWLENDARLNIAPDLRAEAIRQQAETGGMRRGLGWMLRAPSDASAGDLFSADSFGHTGFTGTSLWIDPQRELVVAVLTNRVYRGRHEPGIHAFRRAVHDVFAQTADA